MRMAVGSDERTPLTDAVVEELRGRGITLDLVGALKEGDDAHWPTVGLRVAERVAAGNCDEGVLFCWSGTGVSMAANKVPGVRAALCADAFTAAGARCWNHANVLVMSLRLTSPAVAKEILEAWFSTPFGQGEDAQEVERLREIERAHWGAGVR